MLVEKLRPCQNTINETSLFKYRDLLQDCSNDKTYVEPFQGYNNEPYLNNHLQVKYIAFIMLMSNLKIFTYNLEI